jgi:hypothetical protein
MKSEELLAPEDIKITYSEGENNLAAKHSENEKSDDGGHIKPPMAMMVEDRRTSYDNFEDRHAYDNFEAWNKMYGDERVQPEPPRVLPSAEKDETTEGGDLKSGQWLFIPSVNHKFKCSIVY